MHEDESPEESPEGFPSESEGQAREGGKLDESEDRENEASGTKWPDPDTPDGDDDDPAQSAGARN